MMSTDPIRNSSPQHDMQYDVAAAREGVRTEPDACLHGHPMLPWVDESAMEGNCSMMGRTAIAVGIALVCATPMLAAAASEADPMHGPAAEATTPKVLSGYYVGNSAVRCITLDRLHGLMAERGIDYQYGTQTGAGTTLIANWRLRQGGTQFKTNKSETNRPAGDTFEPAGPDDNPYPVRFGLYDNALANHRWDALILTAYGSHIEDDLEAISNFIEFANKHNAVKRVYLYQLWVYRRPIVVDGERTGRFTQIDYEALWVTRKYRSTGMGWRTFMTRDYHQQLLAAVNKRFAGRLESPVRAIPAGEVFYELDRRIKAGRIPGLAELYARDPKLVPGWDPATGIAAGANLLYADGIHPNPIPHLMGNVANYVLGLTHFAVLSGQSPLGMSGRRYGLDDTADAALIKALQQAVWDVVSTHPHTGVSKPAATPAPRPAAAEPAEG